MRNRKIPVLTKEEWSAQKDRQKLIMERKKKFEEAKRRTKTNDATQ
jgi:glutamate formiminotransferase